MMNANQVIMNALEYDDDDDHIPLIMHAIEQVMDILQEDEEVWVKIFVDVDAIRSLEDPTFAIHFRMPKHVFELLVNAIGNHLDNRGRPCLWRGPLDKILLMVLWVLATPDTFRSTALHFGVSPGVLHYHYRRVIEVLVEMAPNYIQWPNREERRVIKAAFQTSTRFPGVIGVVDGTHVYITAPCEDKAAHLNRHHSHSILAQAVVDHRLLIRDIYVGEPGSLHDSRMFRRSPLSTSLLTDANITDADEHILGDGAYILTDKLLVPYRDNGHLDIIQRNYNNTLSRCRCAVERAFGLAKGKFRRLKRMEAYCMDYVVDHVTACFVLHNFIILAGQQYNVNFNIRGNRARDDILLDDEVDYPNVPAEPDHPMMEAARAAGIVKRNRISRLLAGLPDN